MRPSVALVLVLALASLLAFPVLADVSVQVTEPAAVAVAESQAVVAVATAKPTSCHGPSRHDRKKEARYLRRSGRESARAVRGGASVATATAVSR